MWKKNRGTDRKMHDQLTWLQSRAWGVVPGPAAYFMERPSRSRVIVDGERMMANGWARDGAVQEQIDDTVADASSKRARCWQQAAGPGGATIVVRKYPPRAATPSPQAAHVLDVRPSVTQPSGVGESIGAAARTVSCAEPPPRAELARTTLRERLFLLQVSDSPRLMLHTLTVSHLFSPIFKFQNIIPTHACSARRLG
jgi:hypothetical protein